MPKIYDNIELFFTDGLKSYVETAQRADFCVGYFNLRGWKEIATTIDNLPGANVLEKNVEQYRYCRLLVGMQKSEDEILFESFKKDEEQIIDNATMRELKIKLARKFKDQLTIGVPTESDEIALRKLSKQIKSKKIAVKLFLRHQLHAKLYLAYRKDPATPTIGFLGSSNLTLAGLVKQGELNVDVTESDAANKLTNWFNDRWDDNRCIDISQELVEIIDNSWASENLTPPYLIYLKMAYHLSQEARAGLSEYRISKQFQKELLSFQQNAVKVAAHHLNKRGGVMIGDVVGLGKTITACAVAKIFEEDFYFSILIICPPNLKSMWQGYIDRYDMKANVVSMGEVINKIKDLKRFKLVIIDESHNLRNADGKRYKSIKDYLQENESKVILLSATPFNKTHLDLAAQLGLFLPEDYDLGISPEKYIREIGGAIRFATRHTETFIRSIKAFEKSEYSEDWQELMRMYLVRRTRSFIKENYALIDESNQRKYLLFPDGSRSYFPDRVPKKVEYHFDASDPTDQYARLYSLGVVEQIASLNLPRYGLTNYLNPRFDESPTKAEQQILDNLTRAGRRLMGFCLTNLYKRLESSGYSFLLSVSRHILRNVLFIYAIENNLPLPIGKYFSGKLDDFIEDNDPESEDTENFLKLILEEKQYYLQAEKLYNIYTNTFYDKFDWIRPQFFGKLLLKHLTEDAQELLKILKMSKDWQPEKDRQLNALFDLISKDHPDEKVLVFTQFADTANYLVNNLKKRSVKQIEVVSGDSEEPTHLAHRFSPKSNGKVEIVKGSQELRVLVATDVLSEGQNLQDAHIIVNYDLPWAIIRLIQRAGRVDRIGQKSEKIICYSFLPEDGIEQIINLRQRLSDRIQQNADIIGSDEIFFDGDTINLYDIYSEKSGVLDEDEGEVDLASYAYQIWQNALKNNPDIERIIVDMPNVVYSTKATDNHESGAIVYTRTTEENDVLTWLDTDGKILTQSQLAILKAAHCEPDTEALPRLKNHHELVGLAMDFINDEESRTFAGTLGKRSGVKYRTYMRLNRFYEKDSQTLFANDALKRAIDDIYKYPMREFTRETINRQLKAGISDEELSRLIISLREENKLVIQSDDEGFTRQPHIICSMGLKNS